MAKQKLVIGEDVEYLDASDLQGALEPIYQSMKSLTLPIVERNLRIASTDASGNFNTSGGFRLFVCPQGFQATVHRVSLNATGYTPAAPLTNGWMMAAVNNIGDAPEYMWPGNNGTVLPSIWNDGEDGVRLNDGEQLLAWGSGLPPNLQLSFLVQVALRSTNQRLK